MTAYECRNRLPKDLDQSDYERDGRLAEEEPAVSLLAMMEQAKDCRTRGYAVTVEVLPGTHGDQGFLRVEVSTTDPDCTDLLDGQWWFDAEGLVVQVL